jgi:hypothetical protein
MDGSACFLVLHDLLEVCLFIAEKLPLPIRPLQNGFCFFQHPLPANLSATLARRFPRFPEEASGVSMF